MIVTLPRRFEATDTAPRYTVAVTGPTRVIRAPGIGRTVTIRQTRGVTVRVATRNTVVIVAGFQGLRGLPGEGWIEIPFRFGDATPKPLAVLPAGTLVLGVKLFIDEDFDGAGAALAVGDAGSAGRLIPTTGNDPAVVGVFDATPGVTYAGATQTFLTITAGAGATRGGGTVVIET